MVTQDASVLPNVNKVKMKKIKKKKSKKKKIKGTENLESESETDKLDVDEKIYPLSHYINEQDELVNQMFLTIRGSKLEAMLPPVLKSIPVKELKRLCLHELRGMSKKRILCCINGQVMEGSSGSDEEEEEKEVNENPKHNEANSKSEKRKPSDEQPTNYLQKKIKVEPGLEDSTGSGEKSVLELLELEMRARIIKTMLEKGDDGKKITEDAIAAVMKSAKKITNEGARGNEEVASAVADSKHDSQERKSDREVESENEGREERRGRRRAQGRRSDRRGRRDPGHEGKKGSSTRSQRRRDGSYSDDGSRGRSSRRQRESEASRKHMMMKKKKITRKEFEERMKRAKKNRTYRQRKTSEDDEKAKENENKTEATKEDKDEKTEDKTDKMQDNVPEEKSIPDEAQGEGEASEKEEGEIDSNEEEEGACSPSEISSGSRYSSSRSSSRSWSRSYSRSLSRSPHRGRQRRNSKRSKSRSRSRRRKRSYSRSYSRSRTPEKRRSRSDHQQKSFERKRSRDSPKANTKKDVKKTSPEDISPSREEDWGHKCDIEFVDSEEDFDDNPEATKKDVETQKMLPANRIERASISFSLQKPVGIAQSVDLDDLPLKKKPTSEDVETLGAVKPPARNEEIVISSDSELEAEASKQKSLAKSTADKKMQSEQQLVTSTSNTKLVEPNISLQSHQEMKPIKKTVDSKTKSEETTKEIVDVSTEGAVKLTAALSQETYTEQRSSNEANITQNIKNENTVIEREKQAMDDTDTTDTVVSVNKGESSTKDSNDSEDTDDSESESSDSDHTSEKVNKDNEEHDTPHDDEQMEKKTGKISTGSAEGVRVASTAECKEKSVDNLDKEKTLDVDTTEPHTSRVIDTRRMDDDGSKIRQSKITDNELNVDSEESSDKETKENIEEGAEDELSTQLLEKEEEDQQRDVEVTVSDQTVKSKQHKKKGVKRKVRDTSMCFETQEKVEKSETSTTNEQKKAEPNSKEISSIFENQSEEEFFKGAEQLKFSEDGKEEIDARPLLKDKTPVDPFRIEAGFTRKPVKTAQKIAMVMPERTWMKRGRKKREKAKDVLGMERTSLLKSAQSKSVPSPSQESEPETETRQNTKTPETAEKEETPVNSSAIGSENENSQTGDESVGAKQVLSFPKPDSPAPETSHTEDKVRKIDHDTEIIGVIETSKDTSGNFEDMELGGGSSWSMRWLQSEKVQKVVTSSKMLSRVRKKIQRKEKATKVVMTEKVEETQKPSEPVVSVIGSIEEYERLFGTRVKKDEGAVVVGGSECQGSVGEGQVQDDLPPPPEPKDNPVFGSDDDGEDSEEEALWSKIIKK